MKSWRTTLGGFLGAAGIAMKHIPQTAAYAEIAEALALVILGTSARDNNVTSEQAGAAPLPPLK